MALVGNVNIHINVADYTLEELAALRVKIQNFLNSEPKAKMLNFTYTEQASE